MARSGSGKNSVTPAGGLVLTPQSSNPIALGDVGFFADIGGSINSVNGSGATSYLGGPSGVFFWDGSKTWAQLWAEVLLAAGGGIPRGIIVVDPVVFPGKNVTVGATPYDFTQITFQGRIDSNTNSFGSTVSFDAGVLIDGGTYVALRGKNMVFSANAAMMTPSSKQVILDLSEGSRMLRIGNITVFDSSALSSVWNLRNSSVTGNGTSLPFFNLSSGGAVVVQMLLPTSSFTVPTRCFGGTSASRVTVLADNFSARMVNTNTIISPAEFGSITLLGTNVSVATRPSMISSKGDGTFAYNGQTQEYEHWNATASTWDSHYVQRLNADLASAATIAPTSRLQRVTGSTTITSITPPWTGFIGDVTLLKPSGATWDLATGGNIAFAVNPSAAVKVTYDGTSWYPSV